MEAILNYLKDPGWWFSTFIIAIIASVIAGFLKDYIEKWLSTIFSGLKSWRARREEARKKLIEAVLADQMYFQIVLFRTVIAYIFFVIGSIMFFSVPVLLTAVSEHTTPDRKFFILEVFTPILGLFSVCLSYRATLRMFFALQVIYEYRKRNNLPDLL